MTPQWAAEVTGVPAARIEQAAEWWGTAATGMLLHARGIEQQTKGTENVLAAINLGLATGKYGKPGCGVTTITGQGNGQGGREHGHKCDQLPGNRDITQPRAPGPHRLGVGLRGGRDPGQGPHRPGDHRGDPRRADQGPAVDLLQPGGLGARHRLTAEALDKLEFYAVIDFFLSESAHHADVVLPGLAPRGGRGHVHHRRGPDRQDQPGRRPAGRGPPRLADPRRPRRPARQGPLLPVHGHRADLRGAAGRVRGRHRRLPRAPPGSASRRRWACSGRARGGPPRHATPVRGRPLLHPDGRARFNAVPYRPPAEVVDDEYPVWLTTGRVVSQYLSGTQTRRIGPLVDQYPEPLCEMHPRLAERSASPTATSSRSRPGAGR